MNPADDSQSTSSFLRETFLPNHFGLVVIPKQTTLLYCRPVGCTELPRKLMFAFDALDAVSFYDSAFAAGDIELVSVQTSADWFVVDLDPLQYTRAYTQDLLALYCGAAGKRQRRRVLEQMHTHLRELVAKRDIAIDSMAILDAREKIGWTAADVIDEIQEHWCELAGALFAPTPFGPRYVAAALSHTHFEQSSVTPVRRHPISQRAVCRRLPVRLCTNEDRVATQWAEHSTGYTMVDETGARALANLRTELLEFICKTSQPATVYESA